MHFLSPELETYLVDNLPQESELLTDLARETHLKVLQPRMITDHYQGRLLSLLSSIIQPQFILEIGTYTGYGSLCLAEGLKNNGQLHTIEINPELQWIQNKYFQRSAYRSQIHQHLGDAAEVIPKLENIFDLIFIDGQKVAYDDYYEAALKKTKPGSVILCDNTLWSGKVAKPVAADDKATEALQKFNTKLKEDPRVQMLILPVRDGLSLCRVL
ncbi:MAG: O-methyltransferase [Eudoraea sp.]|nr:O-methyltransferase [Eudoraea sp.]